MQEQAPNTFNQIQQQLANAQPATVLTERSNGTITTGQVGGVYENGANVFFGDIANGPLAGMPYKHLPAEKLTDEYQLQLAQVLAGKALRGSAVEKDLASVVSSEVVAADAIDIPKSPIDKYTEDYVKENPYDHMFDKNLTDEQRDQVFDRIQRMDLRTDDQKAASAEEAARKAFDQQRSVADQKYNLARQSGVSHEQASASADRAHYNTYNELLVAARQKEGLQ